MLCFQIGAVVLCLGACMGLYVNGVGGAPPSPSSKGVHGMVPLCLFSQLSFILVLFYSLIGHPKLHLYSTCLDIHCVLV